MAHSSYASSSNQMLVAAFFSLSVGICFREQIGKMQTWHLSGSIWLSLGFYFLYGVSAAIQQRLFAYATPEIAKLLFQFSALTYHTSYRALILLCPQKQQRLWIIAGTFTLVEFSLNMFKSPIDNIQLPTDSILFNQNLMANFGTVPDPIEQKMSISLIIYVITTDTIFFATSQARIVTVMRELNKVKVSPWLYVEAAFRCICYSGAVFLFFTGCPCIMLMVLLTDADRVRKLVAGLKVNENLNSSAVFQSVDRKVA
ncbi:hypothetical protein DFJ73DRAFT_858319 [Zopfochytrium polystomum]|nr:hypothetical protein DFJ73DRAFT_858319 [Zopfochytrium polystomum]